MRYFEVAGGLRMYVDEEQQEILSRAIDNKINEKDLNVRDKEVARNMVSRGLLNRLQEENKVFYELNGLSDIWRF